MKKIISKSLLLVFIMGVVYLLAAPENLRNETTQIVMIVFTVLSALGYVNLDENRK